MAATPYPFEYLNQSALERRLDAPDAMRAELGMSESEWSELVGDVIAEETGWVHSVVTAEGVFPSEYGGRDEFLGHYPQVRRAMVRLCRASIHEIESDGLEQESAEDRSEIYRPPSAVRDEVRSELEELDSPDEDDIGETRVSLL